jgi:hypothetical protein
MVLYRGEGEGTTSTAAVVRMLPPRLFVRVRLRFGEFTRTRDDIPAEWDHNVETTRTESM